jgi:alpha-D-ribose 1-methylphosphonate 5-triphosphate synthase subunit PhnH
MQLDPVHDAQRCFRKIMEAMASPGSIVELGEEASRVDIELPICKGLLLVALTLLDSESSFAVTTADRRDWTLQIVRGITREIARLSYAKAAPAADADFVLALGRGKAVAEAIASARPGTLLDPQLGATVLAEAGRLDREGPLLLTGPGIESSSRIGVDLDPSWIAERERKNLEFPLGVDLILVDSLSRLAALPRTTAVAAVG